MVGEEAPGYAELARVEAARRGRASQQLGRRNSGALAELAGDRPPQGLVWMAKVWKCCCY